MEKALCRILIVILASIFLTGICLAETKPWAPYRGTSEVNQSYYNETFKFSDAAVKKFGLLKTYEHEVQIWNTAFADYNNYWSSNMPNAYMDTQDFDCPPFADPSVDNLAIGTYTGSKFVSEKRYYTYMALKRITINNKENNKIKANSSVSIKGQKGILIMPINNPWGVTFLDTTYNPGLFYSKIAEHLPTSWEYK